MTLQGAFALIFNAYPFIFLSCFGCFNRFIQWMGCCCGGGGNVKEERGGENNSAALCRDLYFKHPIRTKACEALACFPSFMPLYSGYSLSL